MPPSLSTSFHRFFSAILSGLFSPGQHSLSATGYCGLPTSFVVLDYLLGQPLCCHRFTNPSRRPSLLAYFDCVVSTATSASPSPSTDSCHPALGIESPPPLLDWTTPSAGPFPRPCHQLLCRPHFPCALPASFHRLFSALPPLCQPLSPNLHDMRSNSLPAAMKFGAFARPDSCADFSPSQPGSSPLFSHLPATRLRCQPPRVHFPPPSPCSR